MFTPSYSGQFKRDLKLLEKRGKDLEALKILIRLILFQEKSCRPDIGIIRQEGSGRIAEVLISNRTGCWYTGLMGVPYGLIGPAVMLMFISIKFISI